MLEATLRANTSLRVSLAARGSMFRSGGITSVLMKAERTSSITSGRSRAIFPMVRVRTRLPLRKMTKTTWKAQSEATNVLIRFVITRPTRLPVTVFVRTLLPSKKFVAISGSVDSVVLFIRK